MSVFLTSPSQPVAAALAGSDSREILALEADPGAGDRSVGGLDHALQHLRTTVAKPTDPPMPPAQGALGIQPLEMRAGDLRPMRLSPERRRTVLALALGKAHLNAGALGAAEREFRDALVSDPRSCDAHSNLAATLTQLGRLEEAERQLEVAREAGVEVSPRIEGETRKRRAAGNS